MVRRRRGGSASARKRRAMPYVALNAAALFMYVCSGAETKRHSAACRRARTAALPARNWALPANDARRGNDVH